MHRARRSWASIVVAPAAVLAIVGVAALLSAVNARSSASPSPGTIHATAAGDEGPGVPTRTPTRTPLPATATPTPEPSSLASPEPTPTPAALPTRPPEDLLRYVSKTSEPLPAEYVPPDLVPLPAGLSVPPGVRVRERVLEAFAAMAAAARSEGITLVVVSGYRSYATQAAVYEQEVARYGKSQADRQVAFPGHSEHQLGTTVDISLPSLGFELDDYLGNTREGQWLEAHGWKYGFVLSYPQGKEEITGYRFEPWHYRYLGVGTARYIRQSGLTITEVLRDHQAIGDDPVTAPQPQRDPASCRGPLLGEGC